MLMNMKELLAVANEHNFAIPAFNIGTGQMLTGIIAECEAQKSPVILAIHPLELKFQGDAFIQQVIKAANDTKIPCVIHLDHSGLKDIERAIRDGFTSVMIDASHESFEDNVAITKRVVELAHPLGVSVEAELGTIGTRARDAVAGALDAVSGGFGLDAVSVCVDDALDALCDLTGENASENVINEVFERFCVGK